MPDSFTETTSQGWFSRMGDSIKGIVLGLLLIPLSFVVLWWNEGRALTTANSLQEGAAAVVEVAADQVDPANNKRLIHVHGEARAANPVADPYYGLSAPGLRLQRAEEIYQWVETSQSEKKQKLGGTEETVTTYSYEKKWVDQPVSSAGFKKPEGHANEGGLIAGSGAFNAERVTLGAFRIPDSLVSRMEGESGYAVSEQDLATLPADLKAKGQEQVEAGAFYFGATPGTPQIGDVRTSFKIVKPGPFSLVAAQMGETFEPYPTKAGDFISFIEAGTVSAQSMFQKAVQANRLMTWLLRLGGFLLMAFGFMAMLRPLGVLGSVVPFLGHLVGMGTGLISFALAGAISLVVIAVAWFAVRPGLSVGLVGLALGGFFLVRKLAARSKPGLPA